MVGGFLLSLLKFLSTPFILPLFSTIYSYITLATYQYFFFKIYFLYKVSYLLSLLHPDPSFDEYLCVLLSLISTFHCSLLNFLS